MKLLALWDLNHGEDRQNILLAFQRMAHSVLYGILQKSYVTRSKYIAGSLYRLCINM